MPKPNDHRPGSLEPWITGTCRDLVRTEAAALQALAARLDGPMAEPFSRAVDLIVHCGESNGRVVVTGMGKSGIIAQKIAATLSSTGSPALFLRPGRGRPWRRGRAASRRRGRRPPRPAAKLKRFCACSPRSSCKGDALAQASAATCSRLWHRPATWLSIARWSVKHAG